MNTARLLLTLLLALGTVTATTAGDDRHDRFSTELSGYNEVHFIAGPPAALRGAVSTPATGKFKARIDDGKDVIHYELSYEGLTGTVAQAHIHFGQRHTVGGIVVWLCQGTVAAPAAVSAATPPCPQEGSAARSITTTGTGTSIAARQHTGALVDSSHRVPTRTGRRGEGSFLAGA
jgi:hypothetical protein